MTFMIGFRHRVLRLLLSAVVLYCPLSIIHCGAQSQLSLEAAIRHAQDSTAIAFQSRHEYDYYQLHYDEFTALRKPQLTLRVAPYYQKLISDPTRDYVYLRNFDNFSTAASVRLTQKMLNLGGEAYIGSQAIWTEYFSSDKNSSLVRQFVAAPLLVGYRQTLLGYNPYRWEKVVEDQQLKAARQQHQYDMNTIAEEVTRRFFRLVCAQGEFERYQRNLQIADTLLAIAREKASIAMVTVAELRSLELQRINAANALAAHVSGYASCLSVVLSHAALGVVHGLVGHLSQARLPDLPLVFPLDALNLGDVHAALQQFGDNLLLRGAFVLLFKDKSDDLLVSHCRLRHRATYCQEQHQEQ